MESYRAHLKCRGERVEGFAASRHELMRDISPIIQIRDGDGNGMIVEFLAAVDFMASRNTTGMKMSDEVNVVADGPDHIALHDLHVIDVVQQLHSRRVDSLH